MIGGRRPENGERKMREEYNIQNGTIPISPIRRFEDLNVWKVHTVSANLQGFLRRIADTTLFGEGIERN